MSINAAYLLHQFQATEQLRNEIEERRRVENMLEDQAVELRRSNQELEQFAYVVSHDLKAPLHNLKGFAKLLFEKELGRLSNAGKEYLQIIQEEVNRFEQTIDGLLRYARLSSGPQESMKQVHFDEVLNRVKSQIVLILQEKSGLIQSGPLPTLKANQLQMEQLFLNLLTNALKFTPDGRAPEIGITAQKIDGAYLFCVKDNGIGLPPETGHSIFRLFKQLKSGEKKEGQGIGLSICQKIVNQHGGKIWAESEGIGKGTSFYFTLATG
jgi:signal transduction histidine kinase